MHYSKLLKNGLTQNNVESICNVNYKNHWCRHGQVNKKCFLSQKITSGHKKFDALKVGILFYSMINMKINHFNIILKYEHFHVDLSRFYKIAVTCK